MDPKHWFKRDWIRIIMERILSTVLKGMDPHHNEMDPHHNDMNPHHNEMDPKHWFKGNGSAS